MRDQTRANLTRDFKVEQDFPANSQPRNQASANSVQNTFSVKYNLLRKPFYPLTQRVTTPGTREKCV